MLIANDILLSLMDAPRPRPSVSGRPSSGFMGEPPGGITGTVTSQIAILGAFAALAMTGEPPTRGADEFTATRWVMESPTFGHTSAGRPLSPRRQGAVRESPIRELYEHAALSAAQLAQVFSVSSRTVYAWSRGALPRDEQETHVTEVLSFVRDAVKHFPDARALKQWLTTPISAGAESPLNLMAQRRWRPLRGLLVQLRAPETKLGTPEPLQGSARSLTDEELRRAMRNLSPLPTDDVE